MTEAHGTRQWNNRGVITPGKPQDCDQKNTCKDCTGLNACATPEHIASLRLNPFLKCRAPILETYLATIPTLSKS